MRVANIGTSRRSAKRRGTGEGNIQTRYFDDLDSPLSLKSSDTGDCEFHKFDFTEMSKNWIKLEDPTIVDQDNLGLAR